MSAASAAPARVAVQPCRAVRVPASLPVRPNADTPVVGRGGPRRPGDWRRVLLSLHRRFRHVKMHGPPVDMHQTANAAALEGKVNPTFRSSCHSQRVKNADKVINIPTHAPPSKLTPQALNIHPPTAPANLVLRCRLPQHPHHRMVPVESSPAERRLSALRRITRSRSALTHTS